MGDKTGLDELETQKASGRAGGDRQIVTGGDLPSVDDETAAVIGDAEVNDGGVRTNSAVEPIADELATGAGAPKPPPPNVDAEGREQFEGGVAPTATADYDGPGAPADQRSESGSESEEGEGEATGEPVPSSGLEDYEPDQLAEEYSGEQLEAAAEERGVAKSGTKLEVAERIIAYDRENA